MLTWFSQAGLSRVFRVGVRSPCDLVTGSQNATRVFSAAVYGDPALNRPNVQRVQKQPGKRRPNSSSLQYMH